MVAIRVVQKRNKTMQVNLPAELCAALDLHFGDHLIFVLGEDGAFQIRKIDLEKRPDLKKFLPAGLPVIRHD